MFPTLSFVYNEVKELSKNNALQIITTERIYENDYPYNNVKVIPYNENKFYKHLRWKLEKKNIKLYRNNSAFSKNLNEAIQEFNPDIIHAHFGYESLKLLDNLKNNKAPIVITFHGYDASQMLRNKLYVKKLQHYLNQPNIHAIYVSEFIKQNLLDANIPLKKSHLLYCGIDTDFFTPGEQARSAGPFTFLQISSFVEKKGHIYTLQAFKKFLESVPNKKDYKLILAGGWVLFDEIKAETIKMGLSDNVEFPGLINPDQAKELLSKADVFVHHSITAGNGDTEGLPTALMEAMSMKLPVLSTFHAGIPEMVKDGINGYLVEERDIENYAKRMNNILSWKKLDTNREKIIDQFSNKVHLKNLRSIYQNITGK